ncbi:MAG: hypothetical protein JW767_10915 [Thermoleophilia bacterium]|nr:hypothetical protein [Thermoleophilia bacterium]
MSDDDLRQDDEARHGDAARPDGEARPDDGNRRFEEERGGAANEEQRRREAVKRLRVADLIEEMLIGLVTVGYQKLGLTDQTRELRDLSDARLAIETLRAWIDVLARERGEEGLADLRSTVAAMQLSYARAVAEPSAAGEPNAAAEPARDDGGGATDEGADPEPADD